MVLQELSLTPCFRLCSLFQKINTSILQTLKRWFIVNHLIIIHLVSNTQFSFSSTRHGLCFRHVYIQYTYVYLYLWNKLLNKNTYANVYKNVQNIYSLHVILFSLCFCFCLWYFIHQVFIANICDSLQFCDYWEIDK